MCIRDSFTASQRTLESQLGQNRKWLEQLASKVVGHTISVTTESTVLEPEKPVDPTEQDRLREQAMNDPVVQSMLEVFPAEISEIKKLD